MDKLNELVEMAKASDGKWFATAINPESILAIADAFRELEQRAEAAEAAEAKLAELNKQKPVGTVSISMDWNTHRYVAMVNMRPDLVVSEMREGDELFTRPAPAAVPVVPDYFDRLVSAAKERAEKAMRKFPQPNYVLNKVAEESGEVIKAVIHYTEGREDWLSVEEELIDNLAMLFRLVTEGDGVIGFSPPEEVLRRIEGLN